MLPTLYVKFEKILKTIIAKGGVYAQYNKAFIRAADDGLYKFEGYFEDMKNNDIYQIACVLDPRVKTNWLKKNMDDADEIIERVKLFLKKAYPEE